MRSALLLVCLLVASVIAYTSAAALTQTEKDAIVARHNYHRCNVNPTASSMPAIAWDAALERVAQNYIDGCPMNHNSARTTDYAAQGGSGYVGENMAWGYSSLAASVDGWVVDEVADYTYSSNTCSGVCGHYTQVVWANSVKVGCAQPTVSCPNYQGKYYVCNYAPGGNYNGQKPYVSGSGTNSACGSTPVAVDGTWGAWGACSATCGTGSQTRTCSTAQNGGAQLCTAGSTGSQSCSAAACPTGAVNGGWGAWGTCTTQCGGGTQTRLCNNPAPANGGALCTADGSTDSQICNVGSCGVNGGWGAFGSCSTACGAGVQTRYCNTPARVAPGLDCQGSATQACNLGACATTTIVITQVYIVAYTTYLSNVAGYNAALVNYEATYMRPPVNPAYLSIKQVLPFSNAAYCPNCIDAHFYYRPPAGNQATVGQISDAINAGSSANATTTTGVSMEIASEIASQVTEVSDPSTDTSSDNTGLLAGIFGGVGAVGLGIVGFMCYRRRASAKASSDKAMTGIATEMQPKPAPASPAGPPPSAGSPWSRVLDPSTKSYYYYNNTTKQSAWTKPPDY